MKTQITLLFLVGITFQGLSQGTLEVEVANFKSTDGFTYLQLFDQEDQFMKKAIKSEKIGPFDSQPVVFTITDLPFGTYSISVMHDENENGELDKGTFGIPQEGYGFSNNARGMFGPPSFEDTKFSFQANVKLKIDLIHPPF